jgi:hypothetical protein
MAAAMKDRIVEMRRVPASELRAHPDNWRLHPDHQRSALTAIMSEIGIVDAVIARETKEGLQLIDGHLRTEILDNQEIPVLIVDLTEKEARQMLATFDPVGELAKTDHGIFENLMPDLAELQESADLRLLLDQIHQQEVEREESQSSPEHHVPGMDIEPHEHYDYLVVLARTTQEWNVLCTLLGLEASTRRHRAGVARGIPAAKLLDILQPDEGKAK